MQSHKIVNLYSAAFAQALEVKLNTQENFVRLGAPLFKVYKIRPHFFNPTHFDVLNAYGIKLFTMEVDPSNQGEVRFTNIDGHRISVAFDTPANGLLTVHDHFNLKYSHISLGVDDLNSLTKTEKWLLAAGLARCQSLQLLDLPAEPEFVLLSR